MNGLISKMFFTCRPFQPNLMLASKSFRRSTLVWAPGLARKHYKGIGLPWQTLQLIWSIRRGQIKKGFIRLPKEANVIKLFCPKFAFFCNKLECFPLASLSDLVQCWQVKRDIRLGCKGPSGANTLAYFAHPSVTKKKSFSEIETMK